MSDVAIAFLFSAGATTWVYAKLMRSTGGNLSAVMVICVIVFVLLFAFMWLLVDFLTDITA